MAAPTTLTQFWQNELDAYGKLREELSSGLDDAQEALQTARARLGDSAGTLASVQASLAAAKAALASEGDLGELPARTVAVRRWQAAANAAAGAVAEATDALAEEQLAVAALTGAAAAAQAKLDAAKGQKKAADDRDAVRKAWRDQAGREPLAGLVAAAKTAADPAHDPVKKARDNLAAKLGKEYLDLADARFEAELATYRSAFTEYRTLRANRLAQLSPSGAPDAVEAWRAELDRAWAELGDFVQRAKPRVDGALATLGALQTAAIVGDDEATEFREGSLSADGVAAAADAVTGDRDGALADAVEQQAAYETALATALGEDPTVDPGTVDSSDRDDAVATLEAKREAYEHRADPAKPWTSLHGRVASWLTALSDDAWRTISSYYDARETLEEIAALGAPGPLQALDTAESSYAACLDAAARVERVAFFHRLALDAQAKRLERVRQARRAHLLSLLRGDV
jgi:hypothetical protein